jgi:[ribosomal protein S5]-alanine N-acetyltransferase
MKTPILETDRLTLRPFETGDAQTVFDCWESDPEVAKYMLWTSHDDLNRTKEWIQFEVGQIDRDDWYRFAVVLKETGNLIGTGLIYRAQAGEAWHIGYNLGRKYWGRGYATEAMRRIIQFAKEELGIREITAGHAKENTASENVLTKLGFVYERDIPYECNGGTVMREGKLHKLYL